MVIATIADHEKNGLFVEWSFCDEANALDGVRCGRHLEAFLLKEKASSCCQRTVAAEIENLGFHWEIHCAMVVQKELGYVRQDASKASFHLKAELMHAREVKTRPHPACRTTHT
jgi:hypothetical protein